jgi:uncharacterized protein YqiB (DUF1249 family)
VLPTVYVLVVTAACALACWLAARLAVRLYRDGR